MNRMLLVALGALISLNSLAASPDRFDGTYKLVSSSGEYKTLNLNRSSDTDKWIPQDIKLVCGNEIKVSSRSNILTYNVIKVDGTQISFLINGLSDNGIYLRDDDAGYMNNGNPVNRFQYYIAKFAPASCPFYGSRTMNGDDFVYNLSDSVNSQGISMMHQSIYMNLKGPNLTLNVQMPADAEQNMAQAKLKCVYQRMSGSTSASAPAKN